ncbi:MAG TPA: aminoglycoside phosphotransferase family protein [Candidatus Saccharimonadales bacterium]|nr:aminoglycoside phosphotransferase family protein [Candidatus Saccharimonadales bacterium]
MDAIGLGAQYRVADHNVIIGRFTKGQSAPLVQTIDTYLNKVTIINNELVLKTPHHPSPMHLGALDHEWQALNFMQGVDVSPFEIPQPVEYSKDPAFLVATYVPGSTLSPDQIKVLPKRSFEQIGRDLGMYIARQITSAESINDPPLLAYGWPKIFREYVRDFSDPRYPTLSAVTEKLYEKWHERHSLLGAKVLRVIHGDLTSGNIVFSDVNRLTGIIDFGRLHRGDIADELSCIPRSIGPALLAIWAQELQNHNIQVDSDEVMLWAELKDLQVLPYWIKADNLSHPNFQKWRGIICKRYTNLNWDELF